MKRTAVLLRLKSSTSQKKPKKHPPIPKKPTQIQKNPSEPCREISKDLKDAQIEAVWLKKKSTIVVALKLPLRF